MIYFLYTNKIYQLPRSKQAHRRVNLVQKKRSYGIVLHPTSPPWFGPWIMVALNP